MNLFASRFSVTQATKFLAAGLIGLSVTAAQGQNRFCLGGDMAHLSAAQRAVCSAKLAAVHSAAARFGAPEDWHFVMVCGAEGWKAYEAFSTRPAGELDHVSADTDREARSTYLREDAFEGGDLTLATQRVIAREVAAIVLQTEDQVVIEARVASWMEAQQSRPEAPVLQASR